MSSSAHFGSSLQNSSRSTLCFRKISNLPGASFHFVGTSDAPLGRAAQRLQGTRLLVGMCWPETFSIHNAFLSIFRRIYVENHLNLRGPSQSCVFSGSPGVLRGTNQMRSAARRRQGARGAPETFNVHNAFWGIFRRIYVEKH